MVQQRRQTREAKTIKKKKEKADATTQRLATKQLNTKLKLLIQNQKKQTPIKKKVVIVVSDIKSDNKVVVVERLTPRPRRQAGRPRRFINSEIY